MRQLFQVLGVTAIGLAFSVAVADEQAKDNGAAKAASTAQQGENEKSIRKAATEFVDAFNRGDAQAVAKLWTKEGDYINEEGQRFAGRAAIEEEYAAFFSAHPNVRIAVNIESIRFVNENTAIEDGTAAIVLSPGGPAMSRYTAVHTKDGGPWRLASVRDMRISVASHYGHLEDLEWLIGSWEAESAAGKVHTEFDWMANKNFIRRVYKSGKGDATDSSGMQVIGWDPASGQIVSWAFDSSGAYSHGAWMPHADGWTVRDAGVLSDGSQSSALSILSRIDDDAFGWQSVERTVGDMRLPNSSEVVIRRVKNTK